MEEYQAWKSINRKQSARWQHLSWLKASAFFSLQKNLVSCIKHNNLYLGLVTPSSGWWSLLVYIFKSALFHFNDVESKKLKKNFSRWRLHSRQLHPWGGCQCAEAMQGQGGIDWLIDWLIDHFFLFFLIIDTLTRKARVPYKTSCVSFFVNKAILHGAPR